MPTAKECCQDIRDRFYPLVDRPAQVFFREVTSLGGPEAVLVEVGCGRSARFLRRAAARFRAAHGIDPEIPAPIHEGNIHLAPGFAESLPLPDASVDVLVSMNVVEHLLGPKKAFAEFRRVLRPGGRILTLTPNMLHPPLLLARPLPHSVRQHLNRLITGTRDEDTFPAFYRANTGPTLRRLAQDLGFRIVALEYRSDHPQYLMFSRFCYRVGVWVERHLLNSRLLACLRQFIYAHFEKP